MVYKFKIGIKVISFICIFLILLEICNDLVAEPSNARLMMHDMQYGDNKEYSMAFLGASHTMLSFNPQIFDEKLGCNSMNLGTVSQTTEGTYFLLKDFLKNNSPDTVVMEISYGCYEDEVWEKGTPLPEYWLFDYMPPSLNKIKYFFAVFNKEDYANALFPIYRNRNKLELSKIKKKYEEKRDSGYYQYREFDNPSEVKYIYKGFAGLDWSYENKRSEPMAPYKWDEDLIMEKKLLYLEKISKLCKSKDIDIIWITTPSPVYSIIEMGNYENTHNYFEMLAKQWEIDYYDFNYYRIERLERNDYSYFYDSSHMNVKYADKFSKAVCQVLDERKKGTFRYDDFFYMTCDDMIEQCQRANLYNYYAGSD